MSLFTLLMALESADVRLGLRLVVDAPAGAITPEIREALAEHKPVLMARLVREVQWEAVRGLRWGDPPDAGDASPGLDVKPPSCGGCWLLACEECNPRGHRP